MVLHNQLCESQLNYDPPPSLSFMFTDCSAISKLTHFQYHLVRNKYRSAVTEGGPVEDKIFKFDYYKFLAF